MWCTNMIYMQLYYRRVNLIFCLFIIFNFGPHPLLFFGSYLHYISHSILHTFFLFLFTYSIYLFFIFVSISHLVRTANTCTGPALNAAKKVMQHVGGKLLLFQSSLPSIGTCWSTYDMIYYYCYNFYYCCKIVTVPIFIAKHRYVLKYLRYASRSI